MCAFFILYPYFPFGVYNKKIPYQAYNFILTGTTFDLFVLEN